MNIDPGIFYNIIGVIIAGAVVAWLTSWLSQNVASRKTKADHDRRIAQQIKEIFPPGNALWLLNSFNYSEDLPFELVEQLFKLEGEIKNLNFVFNDRKAENKKKSLQQNLEILTYDFAFAISLIEENGKKVYRIQRQSFKSDDEYSAKIYSLNNYASDTYEIYSDLLLYLEKRM